MGREARLNKLAQDAKAGLIKPKDKPRRYTSDYWNDRHNKVWTREDIIDYIGLGVKKFIDDNLKDVRVEESKPFNPASLFGEKK